MVRQYILQYGSYVKCSFYRTRVRSLAMLVTDSLTNSLTPFRLVDLIDVTLLRLLLLLMLMRRIELASLL